MNEGDLSRVKNFILKNQWGKIEFLEPVDLRFADFEKDV